jgi:hypothetical protein
MRSKSKKRKPPWRRTKLGLPDLDHAKAASVDFHDLRNLSANRTIRPLVCRFGFARRAPSDRLCEGRFPRAI